MIAVGQPHHYACIECGHRVGSHALQADGIATCDICAVVDELAPPSPTYSIGASCRACCVGTSAARDMTPPPAPPPPLGERRGPTSNSGSALGVALPATRSTAPPTFERPS